MEGVPIWNKPCLVKPRILGNVLVRGLTLRLIWNYTHSIVNIYVATSDVGFSEFWYDWNIVLTCGIRLLNPGTKYIFMSRNVHTMVRLQTSSNCSDLGQCLAPSVK